MRCRRCNCIRSLLAVVALIWAPAWVHSSHAAGPTRQGQAGLVVQFADGSFVTRCVPFEGDSITGLEVLLRSGLSTSRSGTVICGIENNGCTYPQQACFCQCTGSTPGCSFWSYWQWRAGSWAFSSSGASDHHMRSGEVAGWHWPGGPLTVQVAFEEIADARRIAPGVPVLTAGRQSLQVHVPYQGDSDGDAQVHALLRRASEEWPSQPLLLARSAREFYAEWIDLNANAYEVQIAISDAVGVNGSATWTLTTTIESGDVDTHTVFLPLMRSQGRFTQQLGEQ